MHIHLMVSNVFVVGFEFIVACFLSRWNNVQQVLIVREYLSLFVN